MCDTNNMDYCYYCNQWHPRDHLHTCDMTYYYCSGCGQYILNNGTHMCPATVTYDYHQFEPVTYDYHQFEPKHYKCPKCKGEFSEPFKKFMGKFKDADIKEIGSEVIIANTKVPIEKYVCPFCSKEMKGLNQ